MSIINNRLRASITLHDTLHVFRWYRGTVTATMKTKLAQKLTGMVHEPLFQVLLDVQKSYHSLDRVVCMDILRRYGLSTNLQRLLHQYWNK